MRQRPSTPAPAAAPARTPLSPAKRALFWLATLLLPLLFFVLVEGALRLGGYGDDYPLFQPVEGMPTYRYQNREVARRYFTRLETVPNSLNDFFLAEKDTATYRLFVQGESSAAGFPFYYGGAFSRMLEQRLQQTFPDRRIEVVNTAMAAVNSYTLLDFSDEILAERPDAVLIYTGHNEYYGALGVGSSEAFSAFPFATRAYVGLVRLRTVQALRGLLGTVAGWFGRGGAEGSTLMEQVVGEQSIPYGLPLYEMGLRQFRSNLSRLLDRYREAGIPVFIGTLASNERDQPPFVEAHAEGVDAAAWQARLDAAFAAAAQGDTTAALAALEAAIRMDTLAAGAYYAKGRLLEAQRRTAEARAAFLAAKDRDALRFRAPEAMNRIIREEAARTGAVVVESQAAMAAASPGGIIGRELMLEHLHPTVDGYFVLSDAFYEALRAHGAIGAWTAPVDRRAARAEVLLTPVDSLTGLYRVQQLKASWPFQPPGVVVRQPLPPPTSPVEQLAQDVYLDRLTWREANLRLQAYYTQVRDWHGALQAALSAIQEFPFVASSYLSAGNIFVHQGRYAEALPYFEAANDLEETALAHRMIGSIYLQRGERVGAVEHLERSVALDPQDPAALYNLAGAYALSQQYDRARETAERLLRLRPDHADARRLLASLPRPTSG